MAKVATSVQSNAANKPGFTFTIPQPFAALLLDPNRAWILSAIILLIELFFGIFIIERVAYTEIDWIAYMQEVEGFLSGQFDYIELKGDTGPLVYPAGFVYLYSLLRLFTDNGTNIRRAQYFFLGFYLLFLAIVHRIYIRVASANQTNKQSIDRSNNLPRLPNYLLILLSLSKRIHSIFVLRLFNDGLSMLLLYLCVYLLIVGRLKAASFSFSLALSIKMNILLFAPGYLLILLMNQTVIQSIGHLIGMLLIQLFLAIPFLFVSPINYFTKAFEFSRVFFYKWTVNLKVLPEPIFLHQYTAIFLLICHFICLIYILNKYSRPVGGLIQIIQHGLIGLIPNQHGTLLNPSNNQSTIVDLSPHFIVSLLFVTNFIGIVFARSLHYQFYVWYFHSLPYLLSLTKASWPKSPRMDLHDCAVIFVNVALLAAIELCWNVYPSQSWSSLLLIVAHVTILVRVFASNGPEPQRIEANKAK